MTGPEITFSECNLVSLRAPLFFLRPAGHAHSSENGGYISCKDGAWNMRDLHETIGSLYRATLVGDIEWQVENGSYFAWVGDRCYRLRQQSFLGLSTKETLWVNTAGPGSWRLMAASAHGLLVSLGLWRSGQHPAVSREVAMLFEVVADRVRRGR